MAELQPLEGPKPFLASLLISIAAPHRSFSLSLTFLPFTSVAFCLPLKRNMNSLGLALPQISAQLSIGCDFQQGSTSLPFIPHLVNRETTNHCLSCLSNGRSAGDSGTQRVLSTHCFLYSQMPSKPTSCLSFKWCASFSHLREHKSISPPPF